MVKANAYGHHLDLITPLFAADILAVSELSEARRLRLLQSQINKETLFAGPHRAAPVFVVQEKAHHLPLR